MSTKKQARAAQKRRQEQFQSKVQAKRRRRTNAQKVVVALVAGGLVASGGVVALVGLDPSDATPLAPSPTPTPTPTPSATQPARDIPDPSVAEAREWTGTIDTNSGPIEITLDGAAAPQAVASFVALADEGYFDGTACHRLVTSSIYVLQCGDPTGTGRGTPGYRFGPIENAPADDFYPAGTIAMARFGGDGSSMGSQFFIVYQDSVIGSDSAGGYTVFGQVTDGLAIVEAIAQAGATAGGAPVEPVILNEVSVS